MQCFPYNCMGLTGHQAYGNPHQAKRIFFFHAKNNNKHPFIQKLIICVCAAFHAQCVHAPVLQRSQVTQLTFSAINAARSLLVMTLNTNINHRGVLTICATYQDVLLCSLQRVFQCIFIVAYMCSELYNY